MIGARLETVSLGQHSTTLVFDSGETISSYTTMHFFDGPNEIGEIRHDGSSAAVIPISKLVGKQLKDVQQDAGGLTLEFDEGLSIRLYKTDDEAEYGLICSKTDVRELR